MSSSVDAPKEPPSVGEKALVDSYKMPILFLLLPLRGKVRQISEKRELSLTLKIGKYLNSDYFKLGETYLPDIEQRAIVIRKDKEKSIIVIPGYGIEESLSFREFLENCYSALREYEPDEEFECIVYITNSEEKFWNVTKLPGDPEFCRMKEYYIPLRKMGRILMGFRRIGAVASDEGVEEISALLISVVAIAIVMDMDLFDVRRKLDYWIKRLKGELRAEDYRRLSEDVISFSNITEEYIFLRQCRSEICARILMEFREVNGIDMIWNEVKIKLDMLRGYMSSVLSLNAEESSMEVLREVETISRLSNAVNDVMNLVNLIAAAGVAFGLSGSVSSLLRVLPGAWNDLLWGIFLFLLSFLTIYSIATAWRRRSEPLVRLEFDEREIIKINNEEFGKMKEGKAGDIKFHEILCDFSGISRRIVWRARRIGWRSLILGSEAIISMYVDKNMRIYKVLCEVSGRYADTETSKEIVTSLLYKLKSSNQLEEREEGIFLRNYRTYSAKIKDDKQE